MTSSSVLSSSSLRCGVPHGLARLIDLYERNFRLLQRLVPELDLPFDEAVSRAGDEPPLCLAVLERARYTVEFRLYYRYAGGATGPRPDVRIRVCRDAATTELLGAPPASCWPFVDEAVQSADEFLDEQWRRNHFLNRWFEYLLARGHGFTLADRPRRRVSSVD
ncbi:MAG TPA: DUF1249 domain-containing protein [Nevskiaceae bacterium]|nr:DUF1249 domain-containing protein [Nevskiaceae bacterium]